MVGGAARQEPRVTSSETQPRRLALWLAGLGLVVVIIVLAVLFLRGRAAVDDLSQQLSLLQSAGDSSETLYEWAGDDARTEAAALRGFTLPQNAAALQLARQGRQRPVYWLRAQLPQAALDAFLSTTCIAALNADTRPAFVYGTQVDIIANLPWWQPDAARRFAGADCTDATGIHYRLLADFDAGVTVTVYLEISPSQG